MSPWGAEGEHLCVVKSWWTPESVGLFNEAPSWSRNGPWPIFAFIANLTAFASINNGHLFPLIFPNRSFSSFWVVLSSSLTWSVPFIFYISDQRLLCDWFLPIPWRSSHRYIPTHCSSSPPDEFMGYLKRHFWIPAYTEFKIILFSWVQECIQKACWVWFTQNYMYWPSRTLPMSGLPGAPVWGAGKNSYYSKHPAKKT